MTSPCKLKDEETTSHPLPAPHASTSPSCATCKHLTKLRHMQAPHQAAPHASTSPSCKRSSEDDEKMADPFSAHSQPKRPRGRTATPVDPVKELAVRMKRQLKLELVSSANSRGDTIDPVSDTFQVRIRSKKKNLFLIIDPCQRKPVMGLITEEDKAAIFTLQYFSTEKYGEICTLFHEASWGYLAVDERTDQPIVHCQTHPPVSSSPDSDLPIRLPLGARPVGGEDDTDSSPPSDPPDPDPCCFFGSVPMGMEACLIPKVCQDKCLSYNQDTGEVWTVSTHRWDFFLLDAEDNKTTLSRP